MDTTTSGWRSDYTTVEDIEALCIGSDVEIAREVRNRMNERYGRVVYSEGNFYGYRQTEWSILSPNEMRIAVHEFDGTVYQTMRGEKTCIRLSKGRIDSILNEYAALVSEPTFFQSSPSGINCTSGFIRFDAGGTPQLEPHDPSHRCRHTLPATWGPTSQSDPPDGSLLAQLLMGSFRSDDDQEDKIRLVAEICGCAALGYATKLSQPKAVILKGETAQNGKSQILDLARGLLPASATCSIPAGRIGDERHIVGLAGKLLNASDELSSSASIASDTFKASVTGEPVSGRDVFLSRTEFRPVAQHIFATNALPEFRGGIDRGVQRRLLVITFNRVIPREERVEQIGERIARDESDLLLAWAVGGASHLIRQRRFTEPPSSKEALDNWLLDEDVVTAWLQQCVEVRPITGIFPAVKTSVAYMHFRQWAISEGFSPDKLPVINSFTRQVQVKARGIEHKRRSDARCFLGMAIRSEGYRSSDASMTRE